MSRSLAANMRRGLSLLEMMVATSIMAMLMASVVVVMRSGYAIWNANEADIEITESAYAVLRHVARQLRQAKAITAISVSSDTSGNLSFLDANDVTKSWSHNAGTSEVSFDNGTDNHLLAGSIDEFSFVGYEADGVTETTTVDDIQAVKCTVQVTLERGGGQARTLSVQAWLRSWQ